MHPNRIHSNRKIRPKNGPFQGHQTRKLGPTLRICQINIEGISRSKSDYISRILREQNVDIVAIQETHTQDKTQLNTRGKIHGYSIIGATFHRSYGIATYARNNLDEVKLESVTTLHDIHIVKVNVGPTTIINVYKPPTIMWPDHVLGDISHPTIVIGDFNSHHVNWKYSSNNINGEMLVSWAETNNAHLVFDSKSKGTFKSGRWNREYNPDLCFVSVTTKNLPMAASRTVMNDFPNSQHRPILIEIGLQIPLINSTPYPRWNFNKAAWEDYANELDKCIRFIPPKRSNYNRFLGLIIAIAKKHMPRGYRKDYIPGWNELSENLYREYMNGNIDVADDLLTSLDEYRKEKWNKTMTALDFRHSSREAWSLLKKLGGKQHTRRAETSISPNQRHTIQIRKRFRDLKKECTQTHELSAPYSVAEITTALKDLKPGKAAGPDGMHPEFLINCGPNTRRWLSKFYTDIQQSVHMNDKTSNFRTLNNGLAQGSVLAPLLFNVYIADLPLTHSIKFAYADDLAIVTQHKDLNETERILTDDLITLGNYFHAWRLKPNTSKTEASCFHLNNKLASAQLDITFNGDALNHNCHPKYLGITLDRTLSFKTHLENTAAKLNSRNNIIHKLCGTSWGASAHTLRCSALGLVYPVAEYCASVWLNSAHVAKVDTQLNTTMRLISGTIKSTPTHWLPTLTAIAPPPLRRASALVKELSKISLNHELPINNFIDDATKTRLKSRKPTPKTAKDLIDANFDMMTQWEQTWAAVAENDNILCNISPGHIPTGFDLQRNLWCTLNRIRTSHGRCADSLHKWGMRDSPKCDCGAEKQTIYHIAFVCPIHAYQGPRIDCLTTPPKFIKWLEELELDL
ncbi:hypothetical protein AGLY_010286 [Aphis glycines]|uniref:Reverse transcriptase domain-containing protein n=2 Tax=Aphis TaxID=464929 RepID=A0A6G0THS5_APHGL|nr:hypothetical protein AGLY_010286 [Aphis glycines]